jgi:ribosomal protein L12E/L44/L45/RPP1/RPP2
MNRTQSIIKRIGRLTRSIRLKRHADAIAAYVQAMAPVDLLQLRSNIAAVFQSIAAAPAVSALADGEKTERDFESLNAMTNDRQLSSDSSIVRLRYIAKWLAQTIHLTVETEDRDLREIYRKAVAVVRSVQAVAAEPRQGAWFIADKKRA